MTGASSGAILRNVPFSLVLTPVATKCALLVAMDEVSEDASVTGDAVQARNSCGRSGRETLWHYTTEINQKSILRSGILEPSLRARNPRDARHGDGQYLTNIPPGTIPRTLLARRLVGHPGLWWRFTHYIQLDVSELDVVYCRKYVRLIPNHEGLDITNLIVSWGAL